MIDWVAVGVLLFEFVKVVLMMLGLFAAWSIAAYLWGRFKTIAQVRAIKREWNEPINVNVIEIRNVEEGLDER